MIVRRGMAPPTAGWTSERKDKPARSN